MYKRQRFRGWSPLIALQIEYSLLQRTVEGDLIPMAREMGMGVTPWSPLKSGVLSGKYTRANHGKVEAGRGQWVNTSLTDRTYDIIDAVADVARQVDSTPARVALAWVQGRPGVSSTIIGARTLAQLDDNLAALELVLPAGARAKLDEISQPKLAFPHDFLKNGGPFGYGGTTINGESFAVWPASPQKDEDRY